MANQYNQNRSVSTAIVLAVLSLTFVCRPGYSFRTAADAVPDRRASDSAHANTISERGQATRVNDKFGKLPIIFEKNVGQTDPQVSFISRTNDSALFLTLNGAVLAFKASSGKAVDNLAQNASSDVRVGAMRMSFVGANPEPNIAGLGELPGHTNYFKGSDSTKWHSKVPNYDRVEYGDLYPGVNLVYYGNEQQLEYDFKIAPGANPGAIKIAFEGARTIRINKNGDLVLQTDSGEIRMHKPLIYQETGGAREQIAGRYVLQGNRGVAFEVGSYDKSKPLVIDPVLTYSSFLGGTYYDYGRSIAVDSDGNTYVTGQTNSFNFPVTINAYSTTYIYGNDVYVSKLNAGGTAIIYSTYIGGNADDYGYGIAIDSSGNAFVTGSTFSSNYPTTPGAYQTAPGGMGYNNGDAFVTKVNSDGTALVYSTYLGGSNSDLANAIALDSLGNAYLAGSTWSSNFPITPGAFQTTISTGGTTDAFVTKLNDSGTALVYSSYLGGTGTDQATGIKVDSSGSAYLTGRTASNNFDVTPGAYQMNYGGSTNQYNPYGDAFVTKFDTTGASLIYSTYLGGASDDAAQAIDLNSAGEVYLTGSSTSVDFPTTAGVVRVGNGGVAKSTTGADSWTANNTGLTNPTELSIAINPSNPNTIFVGSSGGGVFKSTNGAANWAPANSGLTDLTVKSLTIDPATPSLIYLGTASRGVFRSTDSGATWRAINTGQNGMSVNAIKIHPTNSSTIYAGTDQGVFKTTNGGASWSVQNAGLGNGLNVFALAIDPGTPSTVYVGMSYYSAGVLKSTNGGATWTATALNNAGINALVIDPSAPSTVYAATDGGGVLKSTDGGFSWSAANSGLANKSVYSLAISPADSATIYAGTAKGVFKSTNGGAAWSAGNNGLAGTVVNTLAIDPLNELTLYSGSAAGGSDAFITKLNSGGTGLSYSTFLGGSGFDQGSSIALDGTGNAYVTGSTGSQNFPTTHGCFEVFGGYDNDAFVTKVNATGSTLVYSTYLGGTDYDQGYGIAVDSAGAAYVTGYTQSRNYPTTDGSFQSVMSGYNADAFVTKVAVVPTITADLGISMTASGDPYVAGGYVPFNITVTNNGPERASSVVVTDELPSSLIFYSCNSSSNYCSHVGNVVTFTLPKLDVGEIVTMQISATVSCSIPASAIIANTVPVDSSATDPNSSDNSATISLTATNPGTTLSPPSQLFSVDGGSGFVNVNGGANCAWSAVSNVNWATISYSSNCCNGYVNYNVAYNAGAARSGTMTIAGQTFTVSQAGCLFPIDRTSQSFPGNGGSGTVNVSTVYPSCSWTATTNSPFITIDSGASGTGAGTVHFTVAPNAGSTNRSDTITIAGQTFTVYQGFNFADVPANNPFYNDIGKLAARGITLGCGNGNYCPNDPVTRDQMSAFIMRSKGEFNPPTPGSQRFNDVPSSNPFYNYVDRLAVLEITLGCQASPPLYCPSDVVKRDQMAAFIIRGLGEFNPPPPPAQRFTDVPPGNPFYNFIDRMAVLQITLGCSPNMYCPNDTVTRGAMAAFLVRAFNL